MKLLVDFLPIIIFFVVYKLTGDILIATAVLIPATLLQMLYSWRIQKKIQTMQRVTLAFVILLGGATLVFQDSTFIQWKPTVVNWLFSLVFLTTQLIGQKTVVERLMGTSISLPKLIWRRLNLGKVRISLLRLWLYREIGDQGNNYRRTGCPSKIVNAEIRSLLKPRRAGNRTVICFVRQLEKV